MKLTGLLTGLLTILSAILSTISFNIASGAVCYTQRLLSMDSYGLTDFKWKLESCPDSLFATYNYSFRGPCGQIGSPPSLTFDQIGTPDTRISSFMTTDLFTVDVSELSDMSVCLTVAECRVPPILTVVRKKKSKGLWAPMLSPRTKYAGLTYSNSSLSKLLPPLPDRYVTKILTGFTTVYFNDSRSVPRVARIDFKVMGEELYAYVDMTCGVASDLSRRKGFFGQGQASVNGIFLEVLFKGVDSSIPSVHSAMRADLGFTDAKKDFGDTNSRRRLTMYGKFKGKFKNPSRGPGGPTWLALTQLWLTVPDLTTAQMVAGHLHACIDWAILSPPKGNWPVLLLYLLAAQTSYYKSKGEIDFSMLQLYTPFKYSLTKPALDYLVSKTADGLPAFMAYKLSKSKCISKLPVSFVSSFMSRRGPPEQGCDGSELECPRWCSVECVQIMSVIKAATKIIWEKAMAGTPQCSDCPGLVGNFAESVTVENKLYSETKQFPQCLPFKSGNKMYYTTETDYKDINDQDMSLCMTCVKGACARTD